ncbi:protein-export membrane protein SecF [Clostridium acetireducens DSM 10703]|uniref:Protein-export membrane protein SecF n=1 Tax=Clostridium acetireducens DSM 10703 TaxID=1121290 RepID=A0A1E8EWT7_9CLOT|nr:protein translocase subunit SecF [Clostridium acetireducens]OFI05247.1 protein-export membrane protein SecF [Clostridium acetireducens DSM 10703]
MRFKNTLKIIENTKIWFTISLIIIVVGFGALITKGLNYGIDFRGGTILVIEMEKDFNKPDVDKIVKKYASDAITNKANRTQIEIKSNNITDDEAKKIFSELKGKYKLKDKDLVSQNRIGASVGKELKQKAVTSLVLATLAMLLYVAIRFEFKFGLAAILGLVHDIMITIGVYAIFQIPLNSSFIAAILTIVGYSINDTIVIFDRIRENKKKFRKINDEELANISITQTMSRSINTVLTTLITITSVYILVPSVRDFTFPLLIGIVCGCYSSIFISSPIWVIFKNKSLKKARA